MSRFLSIILCFTVFSVTGIGLNTGMVVCFDYRGDFAIEAAHVEHAHRHAEGEHHGHEDAGIGAEHDVLHEAIASCFDVRVEQAWRPPARADEIRPGGPTAIIASNIAAANQNLSTVSAGEGSPHLQGATARAELACLSGIILLV